MAIPQNRIAVVFDFDDTLSDDSTTRLLEAYHIDPVEFWQNKNKQLVDAGWNPTLSYLKLILDNVGEGKPFGHLSNASLRELGATLQFYDGIPEVFDDLRRMMAEHEKMSNPAIEFYIITGGIEEIVKGTKVYPYFRRVWGCQFAEEDGAIKHIISTVTFTEKTKYLFEINKGIAVNEEHGNPYAVNQFVAQDDRRIPFENIIYIGDGLTDVPCFSLIDHFKGFAFGVFDPKKEGSPKKAWETLAAPKRVRTLNSPKYGRHDDLGALLRATVKNICLRMDVRMRTA